MHPEIAGSAPSGLTIEQVLAECEELPVLPTAVQRVIQLTGDSEATASQIADALAHDSALSIKVLRLANSAFYGMTRQVASLREAVVVLGMRCVRNLAVVAGAVPFMRRPLPGYALGSNQLLLHNAAVAAGAQSVAKLAGKKDIAEAAFVAGLLADVGKIPMSRQLDGKTARLLELGFQSGNAFDVVERMVIGFDHAEVGAHMLRHWELPEDLAQAIEFHHRPGMTDSRIADCIHIADYLSMVCGFGLGGDGLLYEFDESTLTRLGLSTNDLDSAMDGFVVAYEHQEQFMKQMEAA